MKGQYTHYLKIPNTEQGLGLRITDRYDWQTFTYKEVEKTGTRDVMVELPTEDDLKADIFIPISWAKYDLSLHTWREPIIRVTAEAKRRDINIGTPMIGQTFDLMNLTNNEWWMD